MQQLEKFWIIFVDVWQHGYMGVDLGRILGALGIFLFFLFIRRMFSQFVLNRLQAIASRTKMEYDDALLQALKNPVRFFPVLLGIFFALEYLELEPDTQELSGLFIRSLVVFLIFWTLYRAITPLGTALNQVGGLFNTTLVEWLSRALKVVIACLGVATVLEIWGIEVAAFLAGLGLFGVAVALGAQDLFKNLIAGTLIIAERRFSNGDWIRVDGVVEGTVESIGFRSTRIRRFDKAPVHVPNAKLSDNAVTNFSAMTSRRIYWMIGLEYRCSVDQLKQVRDGIEALVTDNPDYLTAEEASTFVRVDSFNASSIDLMLYCFTRTTDWGEWLAIKEKLALDIKDVVEGAGCAFAFPSQSVYLESLPEDRPDPFMPPAAAADTETKA